MVTVERADGSRYQNVQALVSTEILIFDERIPVEPDDVILRQLPSGLVERLVVSDPVFHGATRGMPAHYQIKYRRDGQGRPGTPGPVFQFTGNHSRISLYSTDNSTNYATYTSNLNTVSEELTKLREALLKQATDAEHFVAIGAVASAELGAKKGDGPAVASAFANMGTAGKWVLSVAKEIGVGVAVATVERYVGLPTGGA